MTAPEHQPERGVLPLPPSPLVLAEQQVKEAQEERAKNLSEFPHLPWPSAMDLVGPLLPGQLWVVGARPGNGKTTFLLNLFDELVVQRVPVLYLATETKASELRCQWAALRLNLNVTHVLENAWHKLRPTAAAEVRQDLETQAMQSGDVGTFIDLPQLTVKAVAHVLKEYAVRCKFGILVLDHVHRWQVADLSNKTAELTAVVQRLKGAAAALGLTILLAAQCKRPTTSPLAEFLPPALADLKQTGALEEESNVVVMLHRQKKADATATMVKEVHMGQRDVRDLLEPGVMCAAIAKHRNRPGATGRIFRLHVQECCRLEDRTTPHGREPGEDESERLPF